MQCSRQPDAGKRTGSYVERRGEANAPDEHFSKVTDKKPGIRVGCPVFLTAWFLCCDYFLTGAGAGAVAGAGAAAFSGAFSGAGAGAAAGAGAGFFSSCFAQPTKEKETASKRASTSTSAFFISCFTSF
jgi:hypothetical protein